jgi:hypothetical protein
VGVSIDTLDNCEVFILIVIEVAHRFLKHILSIHCGCNLRECDDFLLSSFNMMPYRLLCSDAV